MAKVYVVNDGKTIEVPDGSLLVELDGKSSIPFACREGVCGSCLVEVVEGMENLEPPSEQEKTALESFATSPNQRLLCLTKIKSGEVKVRMP